MKVKALIPFSDLKEGVRREIGDEFEATEERVREINGAGFGEAVEVVPEVAKKPVKRRTAKKTEA